MKEDELQTPLSWGIAEDSVTVTLPLITFERLCDVPPRGGAARSLELSPSLLVLLDSELLP